jgi:ferredoxin-NADP reductase
VLHSAAVGDGGFKSLKAYASGTYGSVSKLTASTAVFVAGGVGITALEPLLKSAVMSWENMTEGRPRQLRDVVLLWAVRNEADLGWFRAEIDAFGERHGDLRFEARLFVTARGEWEERGGGGTATTSKVTAVTAANNGKDNGAGRGNGNGTNGDSRINGANGNGNTLSVATRGGGGGEDTGVELTVAALAAEEEEEVTGEAKGESKGESKGEAKGGGDTDNADVLRSAVTVVHKRPDLAAELALICSRSATRDPNATYMDVFVCGPSGMRQAVLAAAACDSQPVLLVHDETFEL